MLVVFRAHICFQVSLEAALPPLAEVSRGTSSRRGEPRVLRGSTDTDPIVLRTRHEQLGESRFWYVQRSAVVYSRN